VVVTRWDIGFLVVFVGLLLFMVLNVVLDG
jgi:hypothetical protein